MRLQVHRPHRFGRLVSCCVMVALVAVVAAGCGSSGSKSSGSGGTNASKGSASDCYATGQLSPSGATPTSYPPTRAFGQVRVTGRGLTQLPETSADPVVGCKAPTVEGQTFSGSPVKLAADGQPTLIFFLAHWCPHCNREVPTLVSYWQQHGMPQGVKLLSVATGSNPNGQNWPPSQWIANKHWPVQAVADDEQSTAGQAFGLSAYPFYVFLKPDGTVFFRTSGEWPVADINAKIAQLVAASHSSAGSAPSTTASGG